jgi:hypothetical protein
MTEILKNILCILGALYLIYHVSSHMIKIVKSLVHQKAKTSKILTKRICQ